MSRFVLDASALLVTLLEEPGAKRLPPEPEMLSHAVISAVNLAEAQGKLVTHGIDPDESWEAVLAPINEVIAFDHEQAKLAGNLLLKTKTLGLSLGDRACIALGLVLNAPVYTADKQWAKLKLGIPIRVIR